MAENENVNAAPETKPVSAPPATTEVVIDGEKFDENRIRRNHQQAGQVPGLIAELNQLREKVKTMPNPAAGSATKTVETPPATNNDGTVWEGDSAEFKTLVRSEAMLLLNEKEAENQRQFERDTAAQAMSELEIASADIANPKTRRMLAQVDELLNTGIPDKDGKIVPGSAAVNDKGQPVPATKDQIKKAVEYLAQEIASDGQKIRQRKLGPQPPAPNSTGSGQTITPAGDKPMLQMSKDERKAANLAYLAQRRNANGGGSASGS